MEFKIFFGEILHTIQFQIHTIQISKRRVGGGEEVEADGRTFSIFWPVWHRVRSPNEVVSRGGALCCDKE
jgi:hypothetical protein